MKNIIEKINTSIHERRELKKRKKVKKKVMKQLSISWRTKVEQELLILRDVALMDEDLLDYCLVAKYNNVQEWVKVINSYFDLEHKTYNYPYELKYTIGQVHKVIELILIRHEVLILQDKIFDKT